MGEDIPGQDAQLRARLGRFLRRLVAAAAVFLVLYCLGAYWLGDPRLLAAAGMVVLVIGAAFWALRLNDRGRTEDAATWIAYAVLVAASGGAIAVPYMYPAALLDLVLPFAVALPFVGGRRLRVLIAATVVASAGVAVWGFHQGPASAASVPTWFVATALAGNAVAVLLLLLVLLADFAERLRASLVASEAAQAQAQSAIRMRDDFMTTAAHELRTPLTIVKLNLQSAAQLGAAGEEVRTRLESADRHLGRLVTLVESVLDMSQIRDGHLTVAPAQLDLAQLAREVVDGHRVQAERASTPIELDAPAPVRGLWDPARLEQVICNLVSNAIKYGRGTRVEVRVTCAEGNALLTVKDGGIGISEADQARIFARFERGQAARSYGGLGLGLYVTAQIVEASGGRIRVDSAVGQGSTFTVELPLRGTPGQGG